MTRHIVEIEVDDFGGVSLVQPRGHVHPLANLILGWGSADRARQALDRAEVDVTPGLQLTAVETMALARSIDRRLGDPVMGITVAEECRYDSALGRIRTKLVDLASPARRAS